MFYLFFVIYPAKYYTNDFFQCIWVIYLNFVPKLLNCPFIMASVFVLFNCMEVPNFQMKMKDENTSGVFWADL